MRGFDEDVLETNKKNLGSNQNKPKKDLFSCVSVCVVKPKTKYFYLFIFVSVFRTYIEKTEINRTVSKQTEANRNNHKFSETNYLETNQNNPKFLKQLPKSLSIKLFGWSFVRFSLVEKSKLSVSL
jgi:hypothetical protein